MDKTSIITQVKREEDDAAAGSDGAGLANGSTAVAALNERELRTVGTKKPRSRGLLSSFFCCFGSNTGQSRPFSRRHPPTPLSPNHINQNTLEKGYEHDDCSDTADAEDAHNEVYLLPDVSKEDMHRKCIVIDLDETLVHSSFKPVHNADFIVPVEIDGTVHQVYVLKRPHVDRFLERMGELYECVLFTASLAKYADPVANLLDKYDTFRSRLFRESCVLFKGNYVKDLSKLGRDLRHSLIIDNSPASYIFHPENAIPVQSWFDDQSDTELLDIIPFLESLSTADDVTVALQNNRNIQNGSIAASRSICNTHSIN